MQLLRQNLLLLTCALAGLVGCALLLHFVERRTGRCIAHRLGWKGVLLTAWVGVPVHELSHLIAARFFGHRIIAWRLFEPDPASGTLGYVRHAYSRRNLWQQSGEFFVGIAPLFGGSAALLSLLAWALNDGELRFFYQAQEILLRALEAEGWQILPQILLGWGRVAERMLGALWEQRDGWTPLQLYLCIAVACHLAPSARDLRTSWHGILVGISVLLLTVVILSLLGQNLVFASLWVGPLMVLVALAVFFQGLYVLLVMTFQRVRGKR